MPQIETWPRIPAAIRDHLVERMHDRNISLDDLNRLRVWLETKTNVPEGRWFKDFGSFKLCGEGKVSQDISSRRPICDRRRTLTR
jgi:hypothetical protein